MPTSLWLSKACFNYDVQSSLSFAGARVRFSFARLSIVWNVTQRRAESVVAHALVSGANYTKRLATLVESWVGNARTAPVVL
jgi:hypothetical protein